MKDRIRKTMLLAGLVCVMGVAGACGDAKGASDPGEQQVDVTTPIADAAGQGSDGGSAVNVDDVAGDNEKGQTAPGTPADGADAAEAGGTDSAGGAQENASSTGNGDGTWDDRDPDLEGNVEDLRDGKFTLVEFITETMDDGSDLLVSPSDDGDNSEFNKVTVTYDDTTLFAILTIYDGGARSEISEATVKDLAAGQSVNVWGNSTGDGMKATQICIVKVE